MTPHSPVLSTVRSDFVSRIPYDLGYIMDLVAPLGDTAFFLPANLLLLHTTG
jgi:hypothetical protein